MNIAIDAERAVLGAIILDAKALPTIQKHLTADSADWFYEPIHNIVFNTCVSMRNAGTPIDPVTLHGELQRHAEYDLIEDAGGVAYIAKLSGDVPTTANAEHYAGIVANTHRKRRIETVTKQAQANAQNGMQAEEIEDVLQRELGIIFENRTPEYIPDDIGAMFSTEAPPMEFIFDGIVPLNTLAGCDAAGASGKGYFVQQLILSLCTGRPLFPSFPVTKQRNVIWLQSEEPTAEIHRRMRRIANKYELTEDEEAAVTERLTTYSELSGPLNKKDEDGRTVPTQFFNWLREEVRRLQPGLIAIDPRSHYFAGEENSNTDVAAFMNLIKTLIEEVAEGCTVWINHHSSKARQTNNGSEMGRGASASRDAMRCLSNLTCLTDPEVRDAGISNPKLYVKLEFSKTNWTAPLDGAIYFRRGTGEHGGVLEEVDFQAMVNESRGAVSHQLAESLAEMIGENPKRYSIRDISKGTSEDWKAARAELKVKHGASRDDIEAALEHAEKIGLITVEEETLNGGKPKRIPKAVSG